MEFCYGDVSIAIVSNTVGAPWFRAQTQRSCLVSFSMADTLKVSLMGKGAVDTEDCLARRRRYIHAPKGDDLEQ